MKPQLPLVKRLPVFGLLAGFFMHAAIAAESPALDDKQAFIDSLIERMTLEEKIGQLRLISIGADMPQPKILEELRAGHIGGTFNSVTRHDNRPMQEAARRSRLGIPIFFAYDVVHGHRTIFPIGLGLASSWNLPTIARSGRVAAIEASADGLDMTFAPTVDISRDPRWGAPPKASAKIRIWFRKSPARWSRLIRANPSRRQTASWQASSISRCTARWRAGATTTWSI